MISPLLFTMLMYRIVIMTKSQDIVEPADPCSACEHKYTFRGSDSGIFSSPGFPEDYPERTTCCYFFHAADDGRVKINFDYFDLEEASDTGCNFDYIAISSINNQGYKEPMSVYCGTDTPPVYISTYSKLEIIFHSDFTKNANGFLGHYEFLGKKLTSIEKYAPEEPSAFLVDVAVEGRPKRYGRIACPGSVPVYHWHPFSPSTIGCGPGYLTGIGGTIESPFYPSAYPTEAGCTWIIRVAETQRILLSFITMEISSNAICQGANVLMIYDGYITHEKLPLRYCGKLKHEPDTRRQFLSKSERLVLRFQSGMVNPDNDIGFKAVWTAVTLTDKGECNGFQCLQPVKGDNCEDSRQQLCNNQHFCIHASLQCNELPNCGHEDTSDENKCLKHILTLAAYIGGPAVSVVVIVVIVICCYRKYCRQTVQYAVPKEQSVTLTQSMGSTQSSNVHLRSLDRSPRTSSVMYTTSFTDCSVPPTPDTEEIKGDKCNSLPNSNSLPLPNPQNPVAPSHDILDESTVNYKGHQKRPSYHMMRELCYEDGNIIIADI